MFDDPPIAGQGLNGIADEDNWHGKPLGSKADMYIEQLRQQITDFQDGVIKPRAPEDVLEVLEGTPAHPPHLLSQVASSLAASLFSVHQKAA